MVTSVHKYTHVLGKKVKTSKLGVCELYNRRLVLVCAQDKGIYYKHEVMLYKLPRLGKKDPEWSSRSLS